MKSFFFIFLIFVLYQLEALKVVISRVNLTYYNQKFIRYGDAHLVRYGRKSDYYLHIEGEIKHTWANNVSVHLVFFEYLHNEYRRSFVEMHFAFCDMFNKDPLVGAAVKASLAKTGITSCPVKPGYYILPNMSIAGEKFAYVWPFHKARADLVIMTTEHNDTLASANGYFEFTNARKQTKKKNK